MFRYVSRVLIRAHIALLLCFCSYQSQAFQCPTDRPDFFCRSVESYPNSQIKEVDFYLIPSRIISLFQIESSRPIILKASWESPYFGAGVSLQNDQFELMILGGTSRIDHMTPSAYAAIVCHEAGHILGGAPHQTIQGAEWSTSEGGADYFSAKVCLPKYFSSIGITQENIPAKVEEAGYEMFDALRPYDSSGFSNELIRYQFIAPATNISLINTYPSLQCRYENYLPGITRPSCWWK